jgi:hypothetical protein
MTVSTEDLVLLQQYSDRKLNANFRPFSRHIPISNILAIIAIPGFPNNVDRLLAAP